MKTLAMLLVAASACLAQNNTLTSREKAAGWRLLFDGKSLEGWEDPGKKSPPGMSWSVEDGCLKAAAKPRLREDLFTRELFTDFELAFDWRISPGGNSGVKYRIQDRIWVDERPGMKFEDIVNAALAAPRGPRPDHGEEYVVGFEYQVIDDSQHKDAQRGSKYQAGALYDMIGAASKAARPVGEFNQSRLVVKGNHVEHWLNGVKVVDGSLDAPEIPAGVGRRWGTTSPIYKMLTTQPRKACQISLQNHNDEAWFRNIKIKVSK